MIVINIIRLILIIGLCIYSSYTDIKNGIIKNNILAICSVYGMALNIFEWINNVDIIKIHLINIVVLIFISVLLYAIHIWAGGDCKFLITLSILIPFDWYMNLIESHIQLLLILVFTFISSYIYLIFDSIYCGIKKKQIVSKEKLKNYFKKFLLRYISCLSYILTIDQFALYFFTGLFEKYKYVIIVINICLILIINNFKVLTNKITVLLLIITGVAFSIITRTSIISKIMIINYIVVLLVMLIKIFIDEYNYEIIQTSQVKKGMILSTATTLQFVNSKVKGLPKVSHEDLRSRITDDEAESVKKWENSKYGTPTIQIVRKIPFAIFISIGALLFVLLGAFDL